MLGQPGRGSTNDLAGPLLVGMVLRAALGWWGAKPLAGLVIVSRALKDGRISALAVIVRIYGTPTRNRARRSVGVSRGIRRWTVLILNLGLVIRLFIVGSSVLSVGVLAEGPTTSAMRRPSV